MEVPSIQKVQKTVEVPQIQYIDRIVDVPVVKQVGVPAIQEVQKVVEVPQVQYIDKIVDVPVQKNVEVPMIQKVQKSVEVPQIQYIDRIVDVPVVKQVEVPMFEEVSKIVDVPKYVGPTREVVVETIRFMDEFVEVPVPKEVAVEKITRVTVDQVQYYEKQIDFPRQKFTTNVTCSCLTRALFKKQPDIATEILQLYADVNRSAEFDVDGQKELSISPLWAAVLTKQPRFIKKLLEGRADPSWTEKRRPFQSRTVLHLALLDAESADARSAEEVLRQKDYKLLMAEDERGVAPMTLLLERCFLDEKGAEFSKPYINLLHSFLRDKTPAPLDSAKAFALPAPLDSAKAFAFGEQV